MKHYSESNFVVVCTVRNIEKTFKKEFQNLNIALSDVKSKTWVIVESDSSDETPNVGAAIAATNQNFVFLSLGKLEDRIPHRTARIAHSRNIALKELRKLDNFNDIDFIVLADIDGRNRDMNRESFQSSWEIPDWDVVTANQNGKYYDIWALRHDSWCPTDCWIEAKKLQHEIGKENAIEVCVKSKMINISATNLPIRVKSAFGGFAIYKSDLIDDMVYLEDLLDGEEICDHVFVNLKISKLGKRIVINPKMINYNESFFEKFKRIRLARFIWFSLKSFWREN